ncbi:MAG: DNA primase [Clostridiales Family XIII bacterium]|jgi:DNA primase|nr:DNA primase [Clostridiales Family XIII bacterium]
MAIINIADEIKGRADISDLIGRTVSLKRSGSRYVGLCPFHNEKTPSFYVSDQTQSYKCFGCGEHGDIITFYEKYYNLSFIEAASRLAKELGIDWEPGGGYGNDSKKKAYYEANKIAARYYYDALWAADNPARQYLARRGLSERTMKKFGLGYAEGRQGGLAKHLEAKGVSKEISLKLGLVKEDGGWLRDKYFGRVMFPIINSRNKVIGFSGRALVDGPPKYINSDASPVYSKKDSLYAANLTGSAIRGENLAILVEGQMDVIALYEQGIENVTAALGTALTPEQAARLKKYTDNVVIAYDADPAGEKATLRAIDLLAEKGMNVKVLVLDDTKDPDEYIRKHGREKFAALLAKALPATSFKLRKALEKYDLKAPEGSIKFLKEAEGILRKLSPVEAEYYIGKLAKLTGIAEGAIRMEVFDTDKRQERPPAYVTEASPRHGEQGSAEGKAERSALQALQRNILRLVIDDNSLIGRTDEYRRLFLTPVYGRILEVLREAAAEEPDDDISPEDLADRLDEDDRPALWEIMDTVLVGSDPKLQIAECFRQADIMELEEREREIIKWLKTTPEGDEADELTRELAAIREKILSLRGKMVLYDESN